MPIYEYACAKCESEFEAAQRITDAPLKTCPKCQSKRVKRLISRTSFALKGGGWYSDGYGSPGAANKKPDASKSDGESSPASTASSSESDSAGSKSESKPAGASKGKKAVA